MVVDDGSLPRNTSRAALGQLTDVVSRLRQERALVYFESWTVRSPVQGSSEASPQLGIQADGPRVFGVGAAERVIQEIYRHRLTRVSDVGSVQAASWALRP